MTPTIELRTPTSFLFFVAFVVIVAMARDYPEIRWFGYSAFCFFIVLGPLVWVEQSVVKLREGEATNGLAVVVDMIADNTGVRFAIWSGQMVLIATGIAVAFFAFLA